jgi:hypothetical protein
VAGLGPVRLTIASPPSRPARKFAPDRLAGAAAARHDGVVSEWEARFESMVDRQIREAQERGDFDDLPGAGRPLAALDEPYTSDWWLNRLVRRENIGTYALSPALALRREAQDLVAALPSKRTETEVREAVADLNRRVALVGRDPQSGPSVVVVVLDADRVVRAWRDARRSG